MTGIPQGMLHLDVTVADRRRRAGTRELAQYRPHSDYAELAM
jgi:hypothetical protein